MSSFAVILQILLLVTGLFLMIIVLLQRGRGGGLAGAFGGMGGQSAFGTKAGDVFTWITVGCAAAWVLLAGIGGCVMRQSQDEYAKSTFDSAKSDGDGDSDTISPDTDGDLNLPEGDLFAPEAGSSTTTPETTTPETTTPETTATEETPTKAEGETTPEAETPKTSAEPTTPEPTTPEPTTPEPTTPESTTPESTTPEPTTEEAPAEAPAE